MAQSLHSLVLYWPFTSFTKLPFGIGKPSILTLRYMKTPKTKRSFVGKNGSDEPSYVPQVSLRDSTFLIGLLNSPCMIYLLTFKDKANVGNIYLTWMIRGSYCTPFIQLVGAHLVVSQIRWFIWTAFWLNPRFPRSAHGFAGQTGENVWTCRWYSSSKVNWEGGSSI